MDVENTTESTEQSTETTTQTELSWLDSIQDQDLRGHAEVKGWKDVSDVVKSHREAEKFLGVPKESLIRLPKEMNREGLTDVYKRLGMPDDVSGYEIESSSEDQKWFTDEFLNFAHAQGLSKSQAQALDKWSQEVSERIESQQLEMMEKTKQADEMSLKKDWGNQYEENLSMARHGAKISGADDDFIAGMEKSIGYKKTMEFFANIGSKIGEHDFKSGSQTQAQYTPQGAKAKFESLLHDTSFMQALNSGDQSALKEIENLKKMMSV